MKDYEIFSQLRIIPDTKLILRVDGRAFSIYTKKLKLSKPFDDRLRDLFINVSKDLINEFNPEYVYTFSDEINILFKEVPFNGRVEKLDSVITSFISSSFMKHLLLNKDEFDVDVTNLKPVSFDCRVIQTSGHLDKYFKFRQDEAWRNCLNGYAQAVLNKNHTSQETSEILFKLKKSDIHNLLYENGINIAHVPTWHKRGVCLYKIDKIINSSNDKTLSTRKQIYIDLEMELIK